MKAIVLEQFGGPEQLQTQDIPVPKINEGEVLVKTKAIGINPVDIKTRKGGGAARRLKLPIILGWDVSGEIVHVNPSSSFKIGDEVFGMVNFPGEGKTYAEYVATPEEHITLKPKSITFAEAAAIPLAALTAYQALIKKARIHKGTTVFIQGAAGGVGHFAVQIAKSVGAYVIGTGSTQNKQLLMELGTDQYIDYTKEHFEDIVRDVDMVLDCVGGDVVYKTMNIIKNGGMIISTPSPVDAKVAAAFPKVKAIPILVQSDKEDIEYIAGLISAGKLKVHIHRTFSFNQIPEAHIFLEHGHMQGKVAVTVY